MKNRKTRSIVLLAVLWVSIGGVWFAGLNWPRWIASGTTADPVRTTADNTPAEPVIYTLTADPEERTLPADLPDGSEQNEPTAMPAPEQAPRVEDPPADEPVSTPDPVPDELSDPSEDSTVVYVLNTNTKKIHLPDCSSVKDIKESNKDTCEDPEEALAAGYEWCKRCHG